MASFTRRGKRWRVEVWVEGQRASKTFETKAEASAWASEQERKARAGHSLTHRKVRDLFDKYAAEVSPKKPGGKWEITRLAYLDKDLGDLPAGAAQEGLQAWIDRREGEVSGGTILRDLALISAVFTRAARIWKFIDESPVKYLDKPEDAESRNRRVKPGELELLRYVAGDGTETLLSRAVLMFDFAIETGMRGGEICAMGKDQVFENHVHIPGKQVGAQKSEKRDVPLSKAAKAILKRVKALELDPVFGLTRSQKDTWFREALKKAAIKDLVFHDSRHEAITRLSKKLDVLALARMVGHRDIRNLMIYYNPTPDELAAKLD
jgi:integrase